MKDLFKQFNEEMKKSFSAALESKEFDAVLCAAKDKGDGTFKIVISSADQDRQGEIVKQEGLDFTNYKKNPVVLWAHDYSSLPIAVCTAIYQEGNKTIAEGQFAPADANPFAQQVRKLYDAGMVNTASIGFIPSEMGDEKGVIEKAEMIEFSFVPVPANPYALSVRMIKDMALDLSMICVKGINFVIKGDDITTDPVEPIVEPKKDETAPNEAVEPAKPAETAPAEDKKDEKGMVADELAESEAQEAKWDRMSEFFEENPK